VLYAAILALEKIGDVGFASVRCVG
jgi:hypothetical protein